MLKQLQKLDLDLSLIAHSGIQFVDYGVTVDPNKVFQRQFLERQEQTPEGAKDVLRALKRDTATGEWVDAETGQPANSEATYGVRFADVLVAYDGVWLPAPFFKRKGQDKTGRELFESGPSNWAHVRLVKLERPDDQGYTHRLIFAFDTRIEEQLNPKIYLGPSLVDVDNQTPFHCAHRTEDIAWFLNEKWVRGWLSAGFDRAVRDERIKVPKRADGEKAVCAFWAFYAVLVAGINDLFAGGASSAQRPKMPNVRFLNTLGEVTSTTPKDVDLVLDIGNSRTCGVLVESAPGAKFDLKKSMVLELRDISRPERSYREPFRSRCEFARADFGSEYWTTFGGRPQAFKWPSLVRVGPEAMRLHGKRSGAEGDTGLSGPKRYIWDDAKHDQQWHFNVAESEERQKTPVFGEIMVNITNTGDFLDFAGPSARGAFEPKFSRASIFTFMVMELLVQAVSQINAVDARSKFGVLDVPRQLRSVVFTIPTATPVLERKLYERRCKAAVHLVWRAFGWGETAPGTPSEPKVVIAYDEATCTQILYLYTEIAEKFQKSPSGVFELLGRRTNEASTELRLASLDIGGGTTDLMIITYEATNNNWEFSAKQNFREGFRRAGDDILEAIVGQVVIPALEEAMQEAGVGDPRGAIQKILRDTRGEAPLEHKRHLFVTQVLVPIALALLQRYEAVGKTNETLATLSLAEVFAGGQAPEPAVVADFDARAHAAGAAHGFSLRAVVLRVYLSAAPPTGKVKDVAAIITAIMERILSVMCEVVHAFDCDVFLITGRPSRLPVIRDIVLRNMAVPPHRVVFMHDYKVGEWYPFTGRFGTIEDPKTTVVVGALVCAFAEEAKLEGFALKKGCLTLNASTANYIGRMQRGNTIEQDDVILKRGPQGEWIPAENLRFQGPTFIGFRQLPITRWPGTPLFFASIAPTASAKARSGMPWTVALQRRDVEDGTVLDETIEVRDITDKDGDSIPLPFLSIRLQTMREENYWLDTGIIALDDPS